jgi:hypothetical protein
LDILPVALQCSATAPVAAHFIAFNGRWTRIGTLLLLNFPRALRDPWSNIEQ